MIKGYLLNEQRKESRLAFPVMNKKNKAQHGEDFGPKSHCKNKGKIRRKLGLFIPDYVMLMHKQQK